MKKLLSAPEFGKIVVEDTDSHEISFQCTCGQMAMYERRIVLADDEVAEWREGSLDLSRLMIQICREDPLVAHRVVPAFRFADIVGF